DVEHLGGQVDGAGLRPGRVEHVHRAGHGRDIGLRGSHGAYAPFRTDSATAVRTRTTPPFGPGTAPLTSSRPLSASTACTVRLGGVGRALPTGPARGMPWNTRRGVGAPPVEPGLRWLRCWPCEAPAQPKPCRFITPAVPLALVVPMTS